MGNEENRTAASLLTLAAAIALAGAAMASGSGSELWMLGNRPRLPSPETRSAVKRPDSRWRIASNGSPADQLDEIARKQLGDILPANTAWEKILESDEESVSVCSFATESGLQIEFSVCGQLGSFAPYWCRVTGDGAREFAENAFLASPESLVSRAGGMLSASAVRFSSFAKDAIIAPYDEFEFAFSDDRPGANWCHPCRYVFFDAAGKGCVVLYKNAPPTLTDSATGATIRLVAESTGRAPVANLETVTKSVYEYARNLASNASLDYKTGDATKTYCVLISGGGSENSNNIRFWSDTAMFYSTMTLKYGIPKENMYAFISDGLSNDVDANVSSGDSPTLVNSPHDLDGDGVDDVTGAATWPRIQAIFNSLKERLAEDDQLIVFITSHGGSDGVGGPDNYDSTVSLFKVAGSSHNYIDDDELADLTRDIKCPVAFAIESCYSGGFVDDIIASPNRAIGTACNHYELSWGWVGSASKWDGIGYTGAANIWMAAFNSAVRGCKPKPVSGSGYPWDDSSKTVASDADGNRLVSFHEAGTWARDNDSNRCENGTHGDWCDSDREHPQYAQTDNAGMDFFFRKIPVAKLSMAMGVGEIVGSVTLSDDGSTLSAYTTADWVKDVHCTRAGGGRITLLGGNGAFNGEAALNILCSTNTGATARECYITISNLTLKTAHARIHLSQQPHVPPYNINYAPGAYGAGEPSTALKAPRSTLILSDALFTRKGYRQTGWSLVDGGKKTYDLGGGYSADADATLYPFWTANTYTVAFDLGNGEERKAMNVPFGAAFCIEAPVFDGYMLTGWKVSGGIDPATAKWGMSDHPDQAIASYETLCGGGRDADVWFKSLTSADGGTVTLVAQWTERRYMMMFDAAGGTGGVTNELCFGDQLIAPAVSRVGYDFTGWKPEVPDTAPAVDTKFTAQWAVKQYRVTFDANGGEGGWSETMDYGSDIVVPAVMRDGYTFNGWNKPVPATVPAEDTTFTAQWRITLYLVTFDANGGIGGWSRNMRYGAKITAPTVVREGFEFTGWAPRDVVDTVPSHDVTYVACWNSFCVTFDANGGEAEERWREVVKGASVGALPVATRAEHAFLGWFTEAVGGTQAKESLRITSDAVLYAHWRFVGRADEENIYINTAASYEADKDGSFSLDLGALVESYSECKLSVKGLPAGLKFDGKTLAVSGVATKPGVYKVVVSATNQTVKNPQTAEFELRIPNIVTPAFEKACIADEYFAPAGIAPDMEATFANLAKDDWKVAVSGLPPGLKFDSKTGAVTGVATKEGAFTIVMTATRGKEKEVSTATLTVAFPSLTLNARPWGDASATGVVTGGGAYPAGKKVTLKATPAKGCVFAGWFGPDGNPLQGSLDYRTASYSYVTGEDDVLITAKFATATEDAAGLAVRLVDDETAPDGSYSLDLGSLVESPSLPKLAIKGLPSGLKFDAKTLLVSGKATKPGVYSVSVTATNTSEKKGLVSAFTLVVPNLFSPALPGLLTAADAYGVIHAGVNFPSELVDCTPAEGWSVKVSGLPSGLKYDAAANTIKGVPTKAGTATVTFTASKKGMPNETATITLVVDALPTWAVGSFNGAIVDGDAVEGLVQNLTVAANGKLSAKLIDGASQLSLAAPSFDFFDEATGTYLATLTGKRGNIVVTNEIAIYSTALGDGIRGIAECTHGDWIAWQNLWKDKAWTDAAASIQKRAPLVLSGLDDGLPGDDDTITIKFGASGSATAAAVFMTANDKTGAKVKYSASSSGVLIPGSDGSYWLYVYFPPKSGTTFSTPFAKRIAIDR